MNFVLRLDEIERHFRAAWKQTQHKTVQVPAYGLAWQEAKQAITSLIKELVAEARTDPFDFVEPCEPDCDNVRHAYHQGQWDMATRIEAKQEEILNYLLANKLFIDYKKEGK